MIPKVEIAFIKLFYNCITMNFKIKNKIKILNFRITGIEK